MKILLLVILLLVAVALIKKIIEFISCLKELKRLNDLINKE